MGFSHDRRGQSVVVGTVILFGFLIIALSVYQVQFVPAENSEIEFEHSQQVEGDFQDLRNGILQAGSTGAAQSQRIRLGTRYPQRTFFLNPPPGSGTLQTTNPDEFRIENVTVSGGENVEAYWENNDLNFTTRSIQYRSQYNEYRGAPRLTYEHSSIAAEFGDDEAVLLRENPTILRGEPGDQRIAITALTGEFSANGVDSRSVDLQPISQGARTVNVSTDGDSRIVLPTAVENTTALAERWDQQISANVTPGSDEIYIDLDGTYPLRLAEVSVDGDGTSDPAYIVPVGGRNVTVNQSVGVEVRDKYNNPVSGATVSFDGENRSTGDDGRVFTEITDDTRASIKDSTLKYEWVDFSVTSTEADDGNRTDPIYQVNFDEDSVSASARSDTISINGTVSTDTGENLTNATVDLSTSNSSVVTFSETNTTEQTNDQGEFTATANIGGSGNATVFAASGDGVERTQVRIINGSVRFQDEEIFETDEEFDVTTEGFENLQEGWVVVDNGGDSTAFNSTDGETTTVSADEVGGLEDGNTINATLYEDDTEENRLDSDATEVSPSGSTEISIRVDDISDRQPNNPEFYVSYDVEGTYDEIRVSAESTESTASDEVFSTDSRNGESLTPGFGDGQEFNVTVEMLENGDIVAERTIITNADTQNPDDQNDDLSLANSATLESSTIEDESNPGRGPRYDFTYSVSSTGSFSAVQLHVLNRNGNGGSDSLVRPERDGNEVRVDPDGGGDGTLYKLAILVVDENGVVVDERIADDTANDGNEPG